MNKVKELSIPVWWSNGSGMMYKRDYLPTSHPESTYNYILRLGHTPEDFGYYKDNVCPCCGGIKLLEVK